MFDLVVRQWRVSCLMMGRRTSELPTVRLPEVVLWQLPVNYPTIAGGRGVYVRIAKKGLHLQKGNFFRGELIPTHLWGWEKPCQAR